MKDVEALKTDIEAFVRDNQDVTRKMIAFMDEMIEWQMRIDGDPCHQQKLKELREQVAKRKREFFEWEQRWEREFSRPRGQETYQQRGELDVELLTNPTWKIAPPPREVKK